MASFAHQGFAKMKGSISQLDIRDGRLIARIHKS